MTSEIGRELKVSELKPRTVVVLELPDSGAMTIWVVAVEDIYVHFSAGAVGIDLFLMRCGPDLERLTDDTSKAVIHVHEYLGEV